MKTVPGTPSTRSAAGVVYAEHGGMTRKVGEGRLCGPRGFQRMEDRVGRDGEAHFFVPILDPVTHPPEHIILGGPCRYAEHLDIWMTLELIPSRR